MQSRAKLHHILIHGIHIYIELWVPHRLGLDRQLPRIASWKQQAYRTQNRITQQGSRNRKQKTTTLTQSNGAAFSRFRPLFASTKKCARLHRVYLCMTVCECVCSGGGCICGQGECASCPNRSIYQMGAISPTLSFRSQASRDFYFPSFPLVVPTVIFSQSPHTMIRTYYLHVAPVCVCSMSERQYMPWVIWIKPPQPLPLHKLSRHQLHFGEKSELTGEANKRSGEMLCEFAVW